MCFVVSNRSEKKGPEAADEGNLEIAKPNSQNCAAQLLDNAVMQDGSADHRATSNSFLYASQRWRTPAMIV